MTDNQMPGKRVLLAGPARLDRRFAAREAAGQNLENWLHQVAGTIGLALYRRIPVGFEDEAGFHLGVPPVYGETRMDWERARIFVDDEQF
jgi:hypothetical protein